MSESLRLADEVIVVFTDEIWYNQNTDSINI